MKLYTVEQMRDAIKMARNGARSEDNIIDSLNFIKQHSEETMSNNKQQTAVKQFVATFKTSIQIGPDDWKVINPSMLCNQNTTLGEIEHFVNSNNNIGILEFKVIELTYGGGEQ